MTSIPGSISPGRVALMVALVLVPAWLWIPRVLDDPRFDGAVFSVLSLAAVGWMRPRSLPGTGWFVLALVCGLPVALLDSPAPPWGGLVDRAPLLAAWAAAAAMAAGGAALARAWTWILLGLGLAAGTNLFLFFGVDLFSALPGKSAARTPPFAGTNHAVEVLAPVAVAIAARQRWGRGPGPCWSGPLEVGSGLVAAMAVGLHGTLAGWISLPLGLLWVVRRPGARRLAGIMVGLLVLGASWPPPAALAARNAHASESVSIPVRWQNDLDALAAVARHPTGIGLGQFELRNPEFRSPEALRLASRNWRDSATPRAKDPHLEPMLALLETGWLGALFLLVALLCLLRAPLAPWTIAPLLVLMLHALVRSPFSDNGVALALTALLLGTRGGATGRDSGSAAGSRQLPRIMAGLAALLAIPQMGGEWFTSRALAPSLEEGTVPVAHRGALRTALQFRPWDARGWSLLAAAQGRAGSGPEEVRVSLDRALAADPANLFALTARVKLEMLDGQVGAGLKFLRRAEGVAGNHPAVLEARTLVLEDQAALQRRLGKGLLTAEPLAARPHFLAAHVLTALVAARRGDLDESRDALRAALFYAGENRARMARLIRTEFLSPAMVHSLAGNILADWQEILGPGPGSGSGSGPESGGS